MKSDSVDIGRALSDRETELLKALEAIFADSVALKLRGNQTDQYDNDRVINLIAEYRGETVRKSVTRLINL